MKQTITEKIISKHADCNVKAGDVVFVNVDWAFVQDGTGPLTMDVIKDIGDAVKNPVKNCIFLDHASPSSRYELSDSHNKLRKYAEKYGINIFEVGDGICHQIMAENFIKPGEIVVGADSHTCMAGAFGAFASGFGSTDIAYAMATGKMWLRVPSAIKVELIGELKKPSMAKDVILYLIGKLGANGANYKTLEFTGDGVEKLSFESRLTICNMAIEAGAKNGIMLADEKTYSYIKKERGEEEPKREVLNSDIDAEYEDKISVDLSQIVPQVSMPHLVDNVKTVSEIQKEDIKINQAVVGTCTGGRLEDLIVAAEVLSGKKVADGVRLVICPASKKIYKQAIDKGLLKVFIESGGFIVTPGCGPCVGIQGGVLGTGEVCVSTANRNFKGRMGCTDSYIYLASPATVAASALAGRIVNP